MGDFPTFQIFVFRKGGVAICVAHRRINNAFQLFEIGFNTPEASPGEKDNLFHNAYYSNPFYGSMWERTLKYTLGTQSLCFAQNAEKKSRMTLPIALIVGLILRKLMIRMAPLTMSRCKKVL